MSPYKVVDATTILDQKLNAEIVKFQLKKAPAGSVGDPKKKNEVFKSGVRIDIPAMPLFSTTKSSADALAVAPQEPLLSVVAPAERVPAKVAFSDELIVRAVFVPNELLFPIVNKSLLELSIPIDQLPIDGIVNTS